MRLFSWLTRHARASRGGDAVDWSGIVVDLGAFTCGATRLGGFSDSRDPFSRALNALEILDDEAHGVEMGTEGGRLDYVCIRVAPFPGAFALDGETISLSAATLEPAVVRLFGEPYWRDQDDDEVLLFYEDGTVELQFEFPGGGPLGHVSMQLSPIMADPEQRKAYGVDKPWPWG